MVAVLALEEQRNILEGQCTRGSPRRSVEDWIWERCIRIPKYERRTLKGQKRREQRWALVRSRIADRQSTFHLHLLRLNSTKHRHVHVP